MVFVSFAQHSGSHYLSKSKRVFVFQLAEIQIKIHLKGDRDRFVPVNVRNVVQKKDAAILADQMKSL